MGKELARRFDKDTINSFFRVGILLFIIIIFAVVSPVFLTASNITNVFKQVSINGIIAIGMTFVVVTGGIDLSVGSIIAFCCVLQASIEYQTHSYWWVGMVVAIGAGLVFGLVNGILVSYFNVVPFVQTLAMLSIGRGLAMIYSNGKPISGLHPTFTSFGTAKFIGIPVIAWVFFIFFILGCIFLFKTKYGRYIVAIGGNEKAAFTSGINVKKYKCLVYVLSGLLCGIASVVLTARVASGLPQSGEGYELDAIAAVVIGGNSLSGGKATMLGTMVGIFIIGILNNGLDLIAISSYIQKVITGVVIIFAVLLDRKFSSD